MTCCLDDSMHGACRHGGWQLVSRQGPQNRDTQKYEHGMNKHDKEYYANLIAFPVLGPQPKAVNKYEKC